MKNINNYLNLPKILYVYLVVLLYSLFQILQIAPLIFPLLDYLFLNMSATIQIVTIIVIFILSLISGILFLYNLPISKKNNFIKLIIYFCVTFSGKELIGIISGIGQYNYLITLSSLLVVVLFVCVVVFTYIKSTKIKNFYYENRIDSEMNFSNFLLFAFYCTFMLAAAYYAAMSLINIFFLINSVIYFIIGMIFYSKEKFSKE